MSETANYTSTGTQAPQCAVYVAFGIPYLAMSLLSAQTFRKYNGGKGLHIISNLPDTITQDLPYWNPETDVWTWVRDSVENNRKYKTNITSIVTSEKVAYLDCDTLITGSLERAFQYLDNFDICLRAHRGKQTHSELAKVPVLDNGLTVEELPHWNGGVVYYKRSEKTERFFHTWQRNFEAMKLKFDQPALAKTLIESDLRILTLDERWNGGFKAMKDDAGGVPLVAHYHSALDTRIEEGLRHYGRIIARHDDPDSAAIVEKYIAKCRRLRFGKAPVFARIRRLFRIDWHRRNPAVEL